jgi:type II secretory pathway component PulC
MRTPLLHRFFAALSALVLGASVLHWSMQVFTSPVLQLNEGHKLQNVVNADLNSSIFGRSTAQNDLMPDAVITVAPSNLKLIGVITGQRSGKGVAIISMDGKTSPFMEGQEIAPGIDLQSVRRDSVILVQNNQPLELALESLNKKPAATLPQAGMSSSSGTMPPSSRNSKNVAFKLDVQNLGPNHFSFSQAELNKGLQDPKMHNSLGDAIPSPSGGLLLKEVSGGSLLDRLGLRTGDVLRQANGQQLNNLADIPSLYQQFGNGSMVKLELLRGGQPSQIQYTVRP